MTGMSTPPPDREPTQAELERVRDLLAQHGDEPAPGAVLTRLDAALDRVLPPRLLAAARRRRRFRPAVLSVFAVPAAAALVAVGVFIGTGGDEQDSTRDAGVAAPATTAAAEATTAAAAPSLEMAAPAAEEAAGDGADGVTSEAEALQATPADAPAAGGDAEDSAPAPMADDAAPVGAAPAEDATSQAATTAAATTEATTTAAAETSAETASSARADDDVVTALRTAIEAIEGAAARAYDRVQREAARPRAR
jgi:hypothetical protein